MNSKLNQKVEMGEWVIESCRLLASLAHGGAKRDPSAHGRNQCIVTAEIPSGAFTVHVSGTLHPHEAHAWLDMSFGTWITSVRHVDGSWRIVEDGRPGTVDTPEGNFRSTDTEDESPWSIDDVRTTLEKAVVYWLRSERVACQAAYPPPDPDV